MADSDDAFLTLFERKCTDVRMNMHERQTLSDFFKRCREETWDSAVLHLRYLHPDKSKRP